MGGILFLVAKTRRTKLQSSLLFDFRVLKCKSYQIYNDYEFKTF